MKSKKAWRAILVVIAVVAMMFTVVPAGMAKKGGGRGSGPQLGVEVVDFAGNRMWSIVEAPGDTVWFTVTVDGQTVPGSGCVTTASEGCVPLSNGTSPAYPVTAADIVGGRFEGTVTYSTSGGDLDASFGLDTNLGLPECFAPGGDFYEGDFPARTTCLWRPSTPGVWEVGLTAYDGAPPQPTKVEVTLRDHIPGNWCSTTPEGEGALWTRLRPGEQALLPSGEPFEFYTPGDGICLRGGAGGDTMGVGNPATFVLAVQGHLTLTRVGSTP